MLSAAPFQLEPVTAYRVSDHYEANRDVRQSLLEETEREGYPGGYQRPQRS